LFEKALPMKTRERTRPDLQKDPEAGSPGIPRMTLTVEEAADELHLSRPVAYELVKEPDFPSFRIGKRILVNRLGLQRWIDDQSSQPLSDPTDTAA